MIEPIEPTSFKEVIALWSSPAAMAEDIGARVTAARKWAQRDRIPDDWWAAVLASEKARDAGVTAELLVRLAARPEEVRA